MEILVLGYAGESGSRRIYQQKEARRQLLGRYPERFFRCFSEEKDEEQAALSFLSAFGMDETSFCSAGEGGVFAALWTLLHRRRLGASFSQRAIPLRQQTVELCEFFDLDPFRLSAANCFVCLTDEGARLLSAAASAGLCASVIGFTEKGPAIRRTDGEEIAFLRRPGEDELQSFLTGLKDARDMKGEEKKSI